MRSVESSCTARGRGEQMTTHANHAWSSKWFALRRVIAPNALETKLYAGVPHAPLPWHCCVRRSGVISAWKPNSDPTAASHRSIDLDRLTRAKTTWGARAARRRVVRRAPCPRHIPRAPARPFLFRGRSQRRDRGACFGTRSLISHALLRPCRARKECGQQRLRNETAVVLERPTASKHK